MDRLYAPWRMSYVEQPQREGQSPEECIFCTAPCRSDQEPSLIIHRGQNAFLMLNLYPYNNGHLLVAPYAHVHSLQDLAASAAIEMLEILKKAQRTLDTVYRPQGYNIGMNIGSAAGAGIPDHLHWHLVPRWNGDTNFLTIISDAKSLPDTLQHSSDIIRAAWSMEDGE